MSPEPLAVMPPKAKKVHSSTTTTKPTKKTTARASGASSKVKTTASATAPSSGSASSASSTSSSSPTPAASPATSIAVAAAGKTTAKAELCAICCQRIVDGKDDALFCEGSCKQWCHRYCVGVPLSHFVSLAASPSPFTCPICSQSVYEQEISLLKSSVTLLQEEVRSLKAEISSLKEGNQPSPVSIPSSAPNLEPRESVSYGGVGSGCEGGGGGGRRGVTVCGGARGRGRRGAGRVGRGGGHGGTLGRFDVGRSRESSGSSNNGGTGRGGGAGDGCRVSAGRMVRKGELAMIRLENSKKI